MPLQRADDAYSPERFSGVQFPMTDGKNRIVFRVSYEALQDRASADGNGETDFVDTFLKHRSQIEQIASEKYDAGDTERLVTTADLTPLTKVVSDLGFALETTSEIGGDSRRLENSGALSNMREWMRTVPSDAVALGPLEMPRGIPPAAATTAQGASGQSLTTDRPRTAQTTAGIAVIQHSDSIILGLVGLLLRIDEKLESLQRQLPNSDEARAVRDETIANYEELKRNADALLDAALKFAAAETEEEVVVETSVSFTGAINNWWTKRHVEAFDMSLFVGGLGICTLLGAGGPLAAAICGALVGGKQVVEAIKAIKQ